MTEDDSHLVWDGDAESWPALLERAPSGVAFERPPTGARLAEAAGAGVRECLFWLQGPTPEVHDWHTEPGSFQVTLRAIAAARSHGMTVAVASRISRSNARVLVGMPGLLESAGVTLWALLWPRGSDDPLFTARVPRLGLGLPPALAAIDRARRLGLDARPIGAPLCALGPFAVRALPSAPRSYAGRCQPCAARTRCPGVDAAYLSRFGEGELRTLERAAEASDGSGLAALAASVDR